MIAWTIQAALESACFDRVLVSTEDDDIAELSRGLGAEVPFRRLGDFDDYSGVSNATEQALLQAEKHWATTFDAAVQLLPNCPLRTGREILAAVTEFDERGSLFQISVTTFGWMNPWWALRLDSEKRGAALFPEALTARSQDLEELYHPSGAIWIARSQALQHAHTFYGDGVRFFPMDWVSAFDIDTPNDFEIAETLFRQRLSAGREE